jgi:predicted permease
MEALVGVILPIFLVIGFGYAAVWRGLFSDAGVDGLMAFTQRFALPCVLFLGIARLDLGQEFDLALLASFYTGATVCFVAGIAGARLIFARPWEDAVAIGFCCLFSNSLLLGLPITERAYGAEALPPNYAIAAVHAGFCYVLGITAMEIVRGQGGGLVATGRKVARGLLFNGLMIGILAGFAVNLTALTVPVVVMDAARLMAAAAIPAALFGLGGVLYRYRPEGDMRTVAFICAISLVMHPVIVWSLGQGLALSDGQMRSAVITASVAPGVNAYVFANMYGRARRVVASAILFSTGLTALTSWVWLTVLP